MGQYWSAVVEKENELPKVFCYGGFLKLMEHSWWKSDFMGVICNSIYKNPSRVTWVGDYIGEDDVGTNDITLERIECLSSMANDDETDIPIDKHYYSWSEEDIPGDKTLLDKKYLVNHTKKCYLSGDDYYKSNVSNNWCIHPLSLLTAVGNDKGGGDYHSDIGKSDVGSWAGDLISIEDEAPANYMCDEYEFME